MKKGAKCLIYNPERTKYYNSHGKLNSAVNYYRTVTKPEKCPLCGQKRPIAAHHPDYNKPLDVVWACYPCHKKAYHPSGIWRDLVAQGKARYNPADQSYVLINIST